MGFGQNPLIFLAVEVGQCPMHQLQFSSLTSALITVQQSEYSDYTLSTLQLEMLQIPDHRFSLQVRNHVIFAIFDVVLMAE
jgi:hypothetical protein